MKWPAPENEGSFHTVQIWVQFAVSHFTVFKKLSILVKLGMMVLIRAGHYIEIWMMLESRYGEPFHRKSPILYV